MAHNEINRAIVLSIQSSAVPRVDGEKLFDAYGDDLGERLSSQVSELVKEAASMPIEWGAMSLAEGVRHHGAVRRTSSGAVGRGPG